MQNKKGVILCGGKGTRLRPATLTTNKHLLPIVNEPMILFPLRTLIALGIKDILIVTGGEHIGAFADFLGDGSEYGVSLTYRVQKEAGGIAQALSLARGFYAGYDGPVVAILGDNIFDETLPLNVLLTDFAKHEALVVLKKVDDPRRFGVATYIHYNHKTYVDTIVEKPDYVPDDAYAVTGFYIYPNDVFEIIDKLKPSLRGELEITDVTKHYVDATDCQGLIYNGFWSDAGTPESLLEVSKWAFEKRLT
jgi:glucose-1-phosphate thymidylyltransferase